MNEARIELSCSESSAAEAVLGALLPEVNDGPEGSETLLEQDGVRIVATIRGPDLSTLRAAINSFVRLADAAMRTVA